MEEFDITNPSKLTSKSFDLRVEGFGGCIGTSVVKIVDNSFVVILD
ncbi:hypothetical protein GCM10011325_31510 [Dyadobacter sediminis]|nr:hypothetical protein GCM10011325_31510 [Dyadobacter sediminis]